MLRFVANTTREGGGEQNEKDRKTLKGLKKEEERDK